MPISFICPHCGRYTDVAENYAGMTGPCSGCGRPVAVPTLEEWNSQNQAAQNSGRGAVGLAVGGMLALIACGLGVAFLAPALLNLKNQSQLSATETNLKLIAGAMQAYHDRWGSFPPAVTNGADGKPLHSWRVLLLPYLGRDDLYTQYNFREPWNSPNNQVLLRQMPEVFSAGAVTQAGTTPFVVVTGDQTMFPLSTTTSRSDAAKGTQSTVLVVESAMNPVEWTSPTDLSFDNMNFAVNDLRGQCISGAQPDGALVAMVDGSTMWLDEATYSEPQVQQFLMRSFPTVLGGSPTTTAVYAPNIDLTRRYEPVALNQQANQNIDEDMQHGGESGNNLSMLTRGKQALGGIEFEIPQHILCLGNDRGVAGNLPERIDGIPVGRKAERLHFLQATAWSVSPDGTPIGHYEIHYADGTAEMAKIVYGVNLRDWWDFDNTLSIDDGQMVWTGSNQAIQAPSPSAPQIRLFVSAWTNPHPEKEIKTIDFVSYKSSECAPFCVAISTDNPRDMPEEPAAPAEATPTSASEQPATSETQPAETTPAEAQPAEATPPAQPAPTVPAPTPPSEPATTPSAEEATPAATEEVPASAPEVAPATTP